MATLAAMMLGAELATGTFAYPGTWDERTEAIGLTGLATYYAPGVMEEVAINRHLDLDGYVAAVALNRAGDLERVVWLEWADGEVFGPYLVVDCARRGEHFEARERQGYVVEVPAGVARLRGFYGVGPEPVTVWFRDPHAVYSIGKVPRAV